MLSVLMSVFWKEDPEFLAASLHSLEIQSRAPDEVVCVNGPISEELQSVLVAFRHRLPIRCIDLPKQVSFGEAMRIGVEQCHGNLIARMDTDDICLPQRFQRQVEFLDKHKDIDILGSAIAEFSNDPKKPIKCKVLFSNHEQIASLSKLRSPVNHMTVVFRREAVLKAGNYQDDAGWEDYRLWARMLLAGCRFHNLEDTLVLARTGNGFQNRRGGLKKLRHELSMQRYFLQIGFINIWQYALNLALKTPIMLAPKGLRKKFYEKYLRIDVDEKTMSNL